MMYIVEACVCVFICVRCIYVLYIRLVCKALRALREKGRYINVSYYYYYRESEFKFQDPGSDPNPWRDRVRKSVSVPGNQLSCSSCNCVDVKCVSECVRSM